MEGLLVSFWEKNLRALIESQDGQLATNLEDVFQNGPSQGPWVYNRFNEPLPPAPGSPPGVSLVSRYDLIKEAQQWLIEVEKLTTLVLLGATSPHLIESLLHNGVMVYLIEPRPEVWRSVMTCWDWTLVLKNARFMAVFSTKNLKDHLKQTRFPLWGDRVGIKEWRASTEYQTDIFIPWREAFSEVVEEWAGDLSTQAFLGRRWLVNTLTNLARVKAYRLDLGTWNTAVVAGAGPGLEEAIEKNRKFLTKPLDQGIRIFAVDTALPALLARGIMPDMIVCLDGQLASYQHFLAGVPPHIPILADLAGLSLLDRLGTPVLRFRSSHPLASFAQRDYPELPYLDTGLGQVAGVAIEAAVQLGAQQVHLWGLDFAYPLAKTYARGTYVYPYFSRRASRLEPAESQLISFAWRTKTVERLASAQGTVYTNQVLLGYKNRLEAVATTWNTELVAYPGPGLKLNLQRAISAPVAAQHWSSPDARDRWSIFRRRLQASWQALRFSKDQDPLSFSSSLDFSARQAWLALWPLAAYLLHRQSNRHDLSWTELAEESRNESLKILEKI